MTDEKSQLSCSHRAGSNAKITSPTRAKQTPIGPREQRHRREGEPLLLNQRFRMHFEPRTAFNRLNSPRSLGVDENDFPARSILVAANDFACDFAGPGVRRSCRKLVVGAEDRRLIDKPPTAPVRIDQVALDDARPVLVVDTSRDHNLESNHRVSAPWQGQSLNFALAARSQTPASTLKFRTKFSCRKQSSASCIQNITGPRSRRALPISKHPKQHPVRNHPATDN
jgi:hypothetical protein